MAIMTSFSKPGISAAEALAEFLKLANPSSSQPADAGTAVGTANKASAKKALSPIRQLRDPYSNKVYFSRAHTEEELLELEEGRVKAKRLHRCFTLCQIDSIHEDNFVEGSFLPVETTAATESQVTNETESPDPCKKLSLESLVPHDGVNSNEEMSLKVERAMNSLLHDIRQLLLRPRSLYLRQHEYNCKVKDMKKSETALNLTKTATEATATLASNKGLCKATGEVVDSKLGRAKKEGAAKLADLQSRLKTIEDTYQKQNKSLKQQLANEKKCRLELESSLNTAEEQSVLSTTSVDYSFTASTDSKAQGASTSGASQRNQEALVLESSTVTKPRVRFNNPLKNPTAATKQTQSQNKMKANGPGDAQEGNIHARSRRKRRRSSKKHELDRPEPAPDSTSNVQKQQRQPSKNWQRAKKHKTYVRPSEASR
jgi:hypothetical protein